VCVFVNIESAILLFSFDISLAQDIKAFEILNLNVSEFQIILISLIPRGTNMHNSDSFIVIILIAFYSFQAQTIVINIETCFLHLT